MTTPRATPSVPPGPGTPVRKTFAILPTKSNVVVAFRWLPFEDEEHIDVDIAVILLHGAGLARTDGDLAYFNSPSTRCDGAAIIEDGRSNPATRKRLAEAKLNLHLLSTDVAGVALIVSVDDKRQLGASLADLGILQVEIRRTDPAGAGKFPPIAIPVDLSMSVEKACTVVELHRLADDWIIREGTRGSPDGLADLSTRYGIVDDAAPLRAAVTLPPDVTLPAPASDGVPRSAYIPQQGPIDPPSPSAAPAEAVVPVAATPPSRPPAPMTKPIKVAPPAIMPPGTSPRIAAPAVARFHAYAAPGTALLAQEGVAAQLFDVATPLRPASLSRPRPRPTGWTPDLGDLYGERHRPPTISLPLDPGTPDYAAALKAGAQVAPNNSLFVTPDDSLDRFDDWLPYFARAVIVPFHVDPIPERSFGSTLSNLLTPLSWNAIRDQVPGFASNICSVCGGPPIHWRQRKQPASLDVHEIWEYRLPISTEPGAIGVQRLVGLLPVCAACHSIFHPLRATLGQAEEENFDRDAVLAAGDYARFDVWRRAAAVMRLEPGELRSYHQYQNVLHRPRNEVFAWALDVSVLGRDVSLTISQPTAASTIAVHDEGWISQIPDVEGFRQRQDAEDFRNFTRFLGAAWTAYGTDFQEPAEPPGKLHATTYAPGDAKPYTRAP